MCNKTTALNIRMIDPFQVVGLPHAALMTLRHITYTPHVSRRTVAVGISISGHHVQISTCPIPLGDLHE